jgi:glycine cleavage system H protein
MKEVDELIIPDNLRYADDHEWAKLEGEAVRVGISDYAQDQLGDIVFVEFPQVGDTFGKGEEFATIESVKAVVECYMPVGGEVLAINKALEESPELMNQDPYGEGWMVQVKPYDAEQLDTLMTRDDYLEMLKRIE